MRAAVKWHFAVLATLYSGSIALSRDGGEIDLAWLAKTRQGAKAVYEKYKMLSRRLEEECEFRTDKVPGAVGTRPFFPHTRRARVVRLGANMIVEEARILDNRPKQPQIRLQCDNNDYFFTLSKSQEADPFALLEYALGQRKYPLAEQLPGLHGSMFWYLREILAAIDNNRTYLMRKMRFDDGKELLFIEFTHTAEGTVSQNEIYIDPKHRWRVVERRVETPNLAATEQWNYGVEIDGLDFPIKYKNLTKYKAAKAPPNTELTGRLIDLKITNKKPEDFRLSAFGLPEPIDAPPIPKPTPWYLWILAAAIASAAMAILFAWLKRRRAKTDAFSSKAS